VVSVLVIVVGSDRVVDLGLIVGLPPLPHHLPEPMIGAAAGDSASTLSSPAVAGACAAAASVGVAVSTLSATDAAAVVAPSVTACDTARRGW
jgi:hypothetical protein